ncbi:hypothetical protein GIB67_010660 [Kingdonia uniflora]|uniref:Protein FAR1-RELATED SEQUENCE n=1 Tax=Kingdonia uniflora TaxID=39325 RepID=A0A7J7M003_9MAGN|nr:hypothetical protein GIB67_010660 [Kingdonia uniflora]
MDTESETPPLSNENLYHIPVIGKTFKSEDEAYNFYNLFGRLNGFSIRRGSSTRRSGLDKIVTRRVLCCSKEELHETHNHDLALSSEVHHLRSQRSGFIELLNLSTSDEEGLSLYKKIYNQKGHDTPHATDAKAVKVGVVRRGIIAAKDLGFRRFVLLLDCQCLVKPYEKRSVNLS